MTAYLFDLEGILFHTYDAYLKVLLHTMLMIKKKYQLKGLPLPTAYELAQLVGDKPLNEAQNILYDHYEVFKPYQKEMNEFFQSNIKDELIHSKTILIPDSIDLLKTLIKERQQVAIVTNSPRNIAQLLLHKINVFTQLNGDINDCGVLLITPEDCKGRVKPDPGMYLAAANTLGTTPEHCIVFEDSPRGVQAAKNAGMYAVVLKNFYWNVSLPTDIKPDEEVDLLSDSSKVSQFLNAEPPGERKVTLSTLEHHFIKQLTRKKIEQLASESFTVYRNLFIGRNYEQWLHLFLDPELKDAIFYLVRNESQEVQGFYLISVYELMYQNKNRLVLKLYMGMLPDFQRSGIIARAYRHAGNYLSKTYKGMIIEIFENITGPVAYANACRFFGSYLRPSHSQSFNEEKKEYLNFLLKKFKYSALDENDKYLVESQSCVYIDPVLYHQLLKSSNPDIQFFIAKTQLKPGVGLACLVEAIPGFFVHFRATIIMALLKVYSRKIGRRFRAWFFTNS
ncbi:MAG: HAD family phosphatase [Legionella sp.]|nr:HAD family phosphatase [Legionella sp.]